MFVKFISRDPFNLSVYQSCSVGPVLDAANRRTKVLGSGTPLSLDHQKHTKRIQAIYSRFSTVYIH